MKSILRTLEQVEKEIEETKTALADVHGTETEVYARIVGYYRAVKNWNKGKRHEFELRKTFTIDKNKVSERQADKGTSISDGKSKINNNPKPFKAANYEMFIRKTCPNCPPVKQFMAKLDMKGRSIDVDTEEGLSEAGAKGIFASPTVIFYDKKGIELIRCHNVEELKSFFRDNADVA